MKTLAIAIALLSSIETAHASRSCLNRGEAGRVWPTRELIRDDDGCWTFDRRRTARLEAARAEDARFRRRTRKEQHQGH